jgi:glycosyltransferase involved in cell wall biosynthesis
VFEGISLSRPDHTRNVVIYRNELLPPSETFIAAQAAALECYVPLFAGVKRMKQSLPLPEDSVLTLAPGNGLLGKLERGIFFATGVAAGFASGVRERNPALVHAHFALDACSLLPILKELRVPLVVTLHGFDVTTHDRIFRRTVQGRAYLARRKKLWQAAECFICVSEFIRQSAIERGFPASKLWKHFIGIDLTSFTPDTFLTREQIVLFVGRLTEKKGCIHLIRAMAWVEARLPSVRLVIIGDGPLRSSLQSEAARLLTNCEFLGTQSPQVIKGWLNRSRVFCAPSIVAESGDAEGLGMVFCEAQAMRLPVVSFASGGIPEVVEHGTSGLLAPEGNEEILAEYIERFLRDGELWMRASEAGRRRMERRFDLRKQTRLLEQKYDEVCEGYSATRGSKDLHRKPLRHMESPSLK